MSPLFVEFEDDSVVLIPSVILLSMMSLTYSSLTIYHYPFLRRPRPVPKTSISMTSVKTQKSCYGGVKRKSTVNNHLQNQ
ncbi:hypothetical protein PMAYCL1PPCAC_16519 [Pristionchus mayeri]|uniref:Uncharacterized protein n=1 Tax=Pristionchus mayeri TaxID=1317129 RepID=A0AAN5CKZ3_9BILA|nr:hypothetical protein PMAYCL1PPCAC_16519 [Pristionchus mayeri]